MPQTRAAQRRSLARKCTPHVVVGMSDAFGCQAVPGVAPRSLGALVPRSLRQRATEALNGDHVSSMRRAAESRSPENAEPRRRWRKLPVLALPAARSPASRSPQSGTQRRATALKTQGPCSASRAEAQPARRAIWERRRAERTATSAKSERWSRANSPRPSARSRQPRSSASNESRDLRASQPRGRRASRDPAAERP